MDKVLFYEGRWYFFSNFSSFAIYWRGRWWATVEHAYQAAKFSDTAIAEAIHQATSAHATKQIAKANIDKVRTDWHDIKLDVMEDLLRAKLTQHSYIRERLLATGDAKIVEDSPKDSFWGRGPNGRGLNHLGKLWMKLREELRSA